MMLNTCTILSTPALAPNRATFAERCRRIWLLMIALWLMNAFDLAFTILAHQQGLLVESNPIAMAILPHGPMAIALFKITLVFFGSYILLYYRCRSLVEWFSWLLVAVYVGVSIQWMFCYQVYETVIAYQYLPPLHPPVLGMCL